MISIKNLLAVTALMTGGAFISCGNSQKNSQQIEESEAAIVQAPAFNADSAYAYIAAQVQFGPRVPNTEAHRRCGDYLAAQLEKFGAKVYNQHADLVAYNGTILKSRNIIGAYQPENKKRVMLCAHWDSRPYADQDEKSNHQKPIDGANDGASGVGVLLEIARQIQQQAPQVGIDLIFFDSEDYGTPDFYEGTYKPDTWCLGSQYWGRIPHVPDYKARFGILLDMVGGKNATFYYEAFSKQTANHVISEMKKDGILVTDPEKSIGKEKALVLTPEGERYSEKLLYSLSRMEERAAKRLGEDKIRRMTELFMEYDQILEEALEETDDEE